MPDEIHKVGQAQSIPLLKQFETWLVKSGQRVLPKTKLRVAITYCLIQWEELNTYTKGGDLDIGNNRAERAIKPFVIGIIGYLAIPPMVLTSVPYFIVLSKPQTRTG
ncbi:transposase [Glaciecola sp. XM2]|uniref:IS66 family transposase n=1 Tax=Glaciecola sp. XM2 TaxID=1914931 RepID=UPI001BDEBA5C|nr:transposase [Glaciecola sp. XM2]MBT1451704.1 transposase [Glaciecola sp. XM2]